MDSNESVEAKKEIEIWYCISEPGLCYRPDPVKVCDTSGDTVTFADYQMTVRKIGTQGYPSYFKTELEASEVLVEKAKQKLMKAQSNFDACKEHLDTLKNGKQRQEQ